MGSVLILHRLVRRWAGDLSAHLAALALAVPPVAVLMFRFNNPDAFSTLVCLGAVWALWSALETGRTRSLILAGVLVGLGFETKMLQAFLILPAMALVYLWARRPRLLIRMAQLAAAGAAPTLAAPAGSCGAVGRWSAPRCSASPSGSSIPITLQQGRSKLPWRTLGMARSISPALVDRSRARLPLRWVLRVSVPSSVRSVVLTPSRA